MAIYDNNGTTETEIGKVYDNNGTTETEIGKVYDNNGTTDSLIYTAETVYLGSGGVSWTISDKYGCTPSVSGTTISLSIEYSDVNPISARVRTSSTVNLTDISTLYITCSSASKSGNGSIMFGISKTASTAEIYGHPSLTAKVAPVAGTASLNVSGYTGSYYLVVEFFGSTWGNIGFSCSKIYGT